MPTQRPLSAPVFGALALAAALSAGSSTSAQAAQPEGRPVAVSPGDATKVALIRDDCPTFSWGEVEGAKSYDLVVYRLGEQNEHEEPVLRRSFPGSVDGWTPALDQCLKRGGGYAWAVRAVGGKEASEWSPPSLFEVTSGPSEADFEEAVQVVRRYLAEEATGSTAESAESSGAASATLVAGPPEGASAGPTPQSMAMGDSALQVNGSPVLTEATLEAGCIGRRWLDQGDGTVLDCNTRLIWLKDASCLGVGTWGGPLTLGTVQAAVTILNFADEHDCTDYTNLTYSDWRLPTITELCRAGETHGICPVAYYSTSLVDTRFAGSPKVSNGAGDGAWTHGDPFVAVTVDPGVGSVTWWWSDTVASATNRWVVNSLTGHVGVRPKDDPLHVWPVRSGQ